MSDVSEQSVAEVPRIYWFHKREVAGTLAMWAVRQSPYLIPANLDAAIHGMFEALPDEVGEMFSATEDQLHQIVELICMNDQTIASWNAPKSGHTEEIVGSSRYDQPSLDDDFIDLYALSGNICRSLLADQDEYEPASLTSTAALLAAPRAGEGE